MGTSRLIISDEERREVAAELRKAVRGNSITAQDAEGWWSDGQAQAILCRRAARASKQAMV